MTRRNRNRRSAVSDFFSGFSEGYNTINQVAQDIQMQRAATAEPEFAGATLDQAQPSTEPAKSVQMNGQEARQVGPEQATPDSAKTGLGVNQGVKLSKIEPIRMEATMQALPEVAKVQQRYQIAGRDVNPGDTASVDRGRTLAMADVMARYDPAQAMRMRSDLTRQERDDQRFEWEKGRVARDEEKAKREEADQLWLRNLGTVLSSRDPNAIANFYNQQYQDGLTAKVVPGENGAFTVVRTDKAGKVVDQAPFQNVDQFIGSTLPRLLGTRDPLKAYQLQVEAAESKYRRERDATTDERWEREFKERQKVNDATIKNREELAAIRAQVASMRGAGKGNGGDGENGAGVNLSAIDKTVDNYLATRDENGKVSTPADPGLRLAVRALAVRFREASQDPEGAAIKAVKMYQDAMKASNGDLAKAKDLVAVSLDAEQTGIPGYELQLGAGPRTRVGNPDQPEKPKPDTAPPQSAAMRELAARKLAEQEAKKAQEEAKKADLAKKAESANAMTLEQIKAMSPDDAYFLLNSPAGAQLPQEVRNVIAGRAAASRLYQAARNPRLR